MARINERHDMNANLVEGLEGLLQGRYSMALYSQYTRKHSLLFNSRNLNACFLWALFFTVTYAWISHMDQDKSSSHLPSSHQSEVKCEGDAMAVQDLKKDIRINQNFAKNEGKNENNQGDTLNNIPATIYTPVCRENGQPSKGADDKWKSMHLRMIYEFLQTYVFALIYIFTAVFLIPALLGILLDVFVRHLVAKGKGQPMMYGMYRIRRVRSNF